MTLPTQYSEPWAAGPDDPGGVEHEWVIDPEEVRAHVGHSIEIVIYGDRNLAIECVDCYSLIADIDYWESPV